MSWTIPRTWVAGEVPSASTMNTHVRDNIRALVMGFDRVDTGQTTTSTSYTDLATTGPAVTATTGTWGLVIFNATQSNTTSGTPAVFSSVAVSGATTTAANDDWSLITDNDSVSALAPYHASLSAHRFTLTAGSNTFTMKYRVDGGTGSYFRRRLMLYAVGPGT